MSTGDMPLFDMERPSERPFTVGDEVVVDTLIGERVATVEWIGRIDGFPAVRIQSGGGIYTVSAARVRHREPE